MSEVKFKHGDSDSYKTLLASTDGVDDSTLYFVSQAIESEDNVDFGGTIYKGNDALGTTCADHLKTTADITVAGLSGQLGAGIANGDVIPAGTSLQELLVKLLSKELYPNAATKPSIDIEGEKSLGLVEVGATVNIPEVCMTTSAGKFNADYASPVQPTPAVTWSNESMSATVSKFGGVTIASGTTSLSGVSAKVALGTNTITYTASAQYSAPSNSPLTNLENETTKTSADAADGTATWVSGTASKTNVKTTATGVYPVYNNISGDTFVAEPNTRFALTTGSSFELTSVPSEIASGYPLIIEYPASKTVSSFQLKDPSGQWATFAGEYNVDSVGEIDREINGVTYKYKRFTTAGGNGAGNTYKITFNSGMNS